MNIDLNKYHFHDTKRLFRVNFVSAKCERTFYFLEKQSVGLKKDKYLSWTKYSKPKKN